MDDLGPEPLCFLGRRLPSWVELRVVVVAGGHGLAFDQADWRDAVVVVEGGELEVEWLGGGRQRFIRGDLLWLSGLPLRALHNPGRRHRRGPTPGTDESRAGRASQRRRVLTDEETTT